jgi:broad specificity phosphatase PhoE
MTHYIISVLKTIINHIFLYMYNIEKYISKKLLKNCKKNHLVPLQMNKVNRMVNLYFIRHGQGYHNLAYNSFGNNAYSDKKYMDAMLTNEGVLKSKQLYDKLIDNPPDLIYSSPLRRTIQTMNYSMVGMNNSTMFKDVPIILDDRLRELLNTHQCNYRYSKDNVKNFVNDNVTHKSRVSYDNVDNTNKEYPFEESMDDLIRRGEEWLDDLIQKTKKNSIRNIYIYTHGEFIYMFLNRSKLNKLSKDDISIMRYPSNNEIYKITINI